MSDHLPERRRSDVGERLVAVEGETRGLKGEVGELKGEVIRVRGRVHDLAENVGILTGTVEHAVKTNTAEHERMQAALARQDTERAAFHLETRGAIKELHGRQDWWMKWLIGAHGAVIATLVAIVAALWLASNKHF